MADTGRRASMRSRGRVKRAATITLAVVATLLSGAATSAQQPDPALVEAAKKEGRVVVYLSVTPTVPRLIMKRFEERYGIQVDLLEARASEVEERIRSERAAGRNNGDVTILGLTGTVNQRAAGGLQPHGPLPGKAKLIPEMREPGNIDSVPISIAWQGILINTDLVKPEDEPKSWWDLTLPKFKGKILADDPRPTGGGNIMFSILHEKISPDLPKKLKEQDLVFARDLALNERRVARGEYWVTTPFPMQDLLNLRGLPVKGIVPKEGAAYTLGTAAILSGAPHPNAAKLLMNYLIDDEAQLLYAENGFKSTTGATSDKIPPEIRAFNTSILLGTGDPKTQEQMMKYFTEMFR